MTNDKQYIYCVTLLTIIVTWRRSTKVDLRHVFVTSRGVQQETQHKTNGAPKSASNRRERVHSSHYSHAFNGADVDCSAYIENMAND